MKPGEIFPHGLETLQVPNHIFTPFLSLWQEKKEKNTLVFLNQVWNKGSSNNPINWSFALSFLWNKVYVLQGQGHFKKRFSYAMKIAAMAPGSTLPNSTSERSPVVGKSRELFLVDSLLPLDRESEAQALATDCTRCSSSAFRQPHQLTSGCPQRAMTAPLLWCLCREQDTTTIPSQRPHSDALCSYQKWGRGF